jgi:uncharacterized protein (TIGR00255 family)
MRSMTGFGRAHFELAGVPHDVEVRSVNHRYLELRVRLPRALADSETAVRERVQQRLARGKVDLVVSTAEGAGPKLALIVDEELAAGYVRAAERLSKSGGVAGALSVGELLQLPGVVRTVEPEQSREETEALLLGAVERALAAIDAMRAAEGAALARELESRIARVAALGESLASRAGEVQEAARERLRKRSAQLASETGIADPARLYQEIVLAADRLDITEELVRLASHVDQFRSICAAAGPGAPVGRKLDFLMQELGREANTVGSKGSDAGVAHSVVELKTELERIREQVQNVE